MNNKYKLLEKQMDSNEISEFIASSFKYTFIDESDAIEISKNNKTDIVRFGDTLEHGRMRYASMRHGKLSPFIGEVHSAFKAKTWIKYSDEYKKAINDLRSVIEFNDFPVSEELKKLSNYLLPKEEEDKNEDKK